MTRAPILLILLAFARLDAFAQINVVPGTNIHIENGTTINILSSQQELVVNAGALITNNGVIHLGADVTINESSGSPIKGSGTEEISITAPGPLLNAEPGGLGCEISTNTALGNITIVRGHTAYQNNLTDLSVKRWFDVSTDVNGGLDLDLRFHYDTTELNGNIENTLEVNYSTNNGVDWQIFQSSVDLGNKFVATSALDSLSLFTLFAPGLNTSIEEPDENEDLLIFPVPSTGIVWIKTQKDLEPVMSLTVLDQLGRIILHKKLDHTNSEAIKLDGSSLDPGIYSVVLQREGHRSNAKMVIEK